MVREKLARQTSDRNSAFGARFVNVDGVAKRLQKYFVFKEAEERTLQRFAIDRREILANVHFKIITSAARISLSQRDRRRLSLPLATSETLVDLPPLENRLANADNRVLRHSVAKRRDRDFPLLRIENFEPRKGAPTIPAFRQLAPERRQIRVEIFAKTERFRLVALSGDRSQIGSAQVFRVDDSLD